MKGELLYQANPNFVMRTIAGEKVLVSIKGGVADFSGVITLNDTAATVWSCLLKGAALSDLVKAMTDQYEVSEDAARTDIAEVIRMLESRKMITHE